MSADRLEVARLEYDRHSLLVLVFHEVTTTGCSCCLRLGKLSPELKKLWAFPVPCPRHERMAFHYEMDQPGITIRDWAYRVATLDSWLHGVLRELDGAVEETPGEKRPVEARQAVVDRARPGPRVVPGSPAPASPRPSQEAKA